MSSSCCPPGEYDKIFDDRRARARARDYARHGLTADSRRIFDFVRERLPGGYDVLEVGGVSLHRRGPIWQLIALERRG